jgi:hypothetical protein
MRSNKTTVEEYLQELPEERRGPMEELRGVILENLPEGLEEGMQYGMIGYFVPLSRYPKGYHCTPGEPLPFISLASQKNSINVYHMGMYMEEEILNWYLGEYPKYIKTKPDMGKSCIRFKRVDQLPLKLIGELMQKMSVERYIEIYEEAIVKK